MLTNCWVTKPLICYDREVLCLCLTQSFEMYSVALAWGWWSGPSCWWCVYVRLYSYDHRGCAGSVERAASLKSSIVHCHQACSIDHRTGCVEVKLFGSEIDVSKSWLQHYGLYYNIWHSAGTSSLFIFLLFKSKSSFLSRFFLLSLIPFIEQRDSLTGLELGGGALLLKESARANLGLVVIIWASLWDHISPSHSLW